MSYDFLLNPHTFPFVEVSDLANIDEQDSKKIQFILLILSKIF